MAVDFPELRQLQLRDDVSLLQLLAEAPLTERVKYLEGLSCVERGALLSDPKVFLRPSELERWELRMMRGTW